MVVIILFSIESRENVLSSEKPISIVPSDSQGFVDIFLSEFLFQNLLWSFLIELSLCKPQKS